MIHFDIDFILPWVNFMFVKLSPECSKIWILSREKRVKFSVKVVLALILPQRLLAAFPTFFDQPPCFKFIGMSYLDFINIFCFFFFVSRNFMHFLVTKLYWKVPTERRCLVHLWLFEREICKLLVFIWLWSLKWYSDFFAFAKSEMIRLFWKFCQDEKI